MDHARVRRWTAGAIVTTLLGGLLTLLAVAPAQAAHTTAALEISPEVSTAAVGAPKTVTARLVDRTTGAPAPVAAGNSVPIDFEFVGGPVDTDGNSPTSPDATCTVLATFSTCELVLVGANRGTTLIRGWVREAGFVNADLAEGRLSSQLRDCNTETDPRAFAACQGGTETAGDNTERDQTDVVSVQWTTGPAQLDCSPESQTVPHQADTTVTCTARDELGNTLQNQKIDGENLNTANDSDSSAAAGDPDYDDGCVTGDDGSCAITVKAAPGGSNSRNNQLGTATLCFWIDSDDDSTQLTDDAFDPAGPPADGGQCGEANDATENANVTDRVTVTWAQRALTTLDVTPEIATNTVGTTQTFTATIRDQFGATWPTSTVVTFTFLAGSPNTANKTCTTTEAGTCTVAVSSNSVGTDTICAWIPVTGATGPPNANCNGETQAGGTNTARIDVVQANWQAAGSPTTTTTPPGGGGSGSSGQGYSLVGEDGSLYAFGTAKNVGDMKGKNLNAPIIGVAYTPGGNGYWLVARDGGIFTFGNADFYGSMGDKKLNSPVIGMAATPTGKGYWLFAGDGGIFTFGDAVFYGSMGDKQLNAPVINMEPIESGNGYWLVAADGGIFTFGQAEFFGSMGDKKINQPVFDMTSTDTDKGYWLVARDGGVFSFGDAETKFYGNPVNDTNPRPTRIIGMDSTPGSLGYWIADANGKVWNYGNAQALGDRYQAANPAPMIGFASVPGLKP
jgi:hypothetical protein